MMGKVNDMSHDDQANGVTVDVPTDEDMRALGERVARQVHGGDVLLLSGPLGAGKTTFAQGFGRGLGIGEPIVSPTFTIARELDGRFADGTPAHLVHVDAYRLGGNAYAPGQDAIGRLLDELESLGLDEELEDPGEQTVILMEWGEQMVAALAPERLEIHIDRSIAADGPAAAGTMADGSDVDAELTGDGMRVVTLVPVGTRWRGFAL
ncbi:ATPase [Bifidobacterium ramosum]|uniref:tRNA threonylcarbamoyladenosine biosynthesis protein TsaE n=2 Tax=Bifidobacterium ramosum TaxID=1798158 RepID=A0A6L4X1W1_9BIFI|nr:ATPase [Bifidobacterium ramosum]NEG70739.1 tRNA (adenosine(37)-N6)-threonylcarbamoyltransferase complex ATPase subunit type 1 TsaE [Bifidobacterium ramosum]